MMNKIIKLVVEPVEKVEEMKAIAYIIPKNITGINEIKRNSVSRLFIHTRYKKNLLWSSFLILLFFVINSFYSMRDRS